MTDHPAKNSDVDHFLPVNLGVSMQIELALGPGQDKAQFQSKLVGLEEGSYLIVKLLDVKQVRNFQEVFFRGIELVVRYLHSGSVLGFRSTILKVMFNPTFIVIEYPEHVESQELRASKRIKCVLPARLGIGDDLLEGLIITLSKTGALFTMKISQDKNRLSDLIDKEIHLEIDLPGVEKQPQIPCILKNVKKTQGKMNSGLKFCDGRNMTKDSIYKYLSKVEATLFG